MSSSGLSGIEIYVAVRAPGTVCSLVSGVFLLIVPSFGDAIRLSEYAVAKRLTVASKPRSWLLVIRLDAILVTTRHYGDREREEVSSYTDQY